MSYFVRPSKDELRSVEEERKMIEEFAGILEERASSLGVEKSRIEEEIGKKRVMFEERKILLEKKGNAVIKKHGLLGFRRVALLNNSKLTVSIERESILGVDYKYPDVESKIGYSLTLSDLLVDDLCQYSESFLEDLIVLARFVQSERWLSRELKMVRRKLNAINNVVLPELEKRGKKIKKYLAEKERDSWVRQKKVIEEVISN